jgi:hypothetical protein
MDFKKIAIEIFNQIQQQGMSTDYCYSPDFKEMCKEKSIAIAKRRYSKNDFELIKQEIEKI